MDAFSTAELVIGILGNLTATYLFLSPVSTCREIHRKRSVGQFSPLSYFAMFLNCGVWAAYGVFLIGSNRILVLTTNSTGLFLSFIYIVFFAYYADKQNRRKVLVLLLIVLKVLIVAFGVTALVLEFFTKHDQKKQRGATILGTLGIMANLFLYASPLSIAKKVFKTRDVRFWPLGTSLASFLNGLVWTIYAAYPINTYILIPNVLGCFLGLVQLIIYAKFKNNASTELNDQQIADHENATGSCEEGIATIELRIDRANFSLISTH